MSCEGWIGAVMRVWGKRKLDSFDVDLKDKK